MRTESPPIAVRKSIAYCRKLSNGLFIFSPQIVEPSASLVLPKLPVQRFLHHLPWAVGPVPPWVAALFSAPPAACGILRPGPLAMAHPCMKPVHPVPLPCPEPFGRGRLSPMRWMPAQAEVAAAGFMLFMLSMRCLSTPMWCTGARSIRLFGCSAVRLFGCSAVRLFGCSAVRLFNLILQNYIKLSEQQDFFVRKVAPLASGLLCNLPHRGLYHFVPWQTL